MEIETPVGVIDDVARVTSPLGKVLGLRFRKQGRALFIFPRGTTAPLDMAFVPVPLDVAFLAADGHVLDTQRMEPWTVNPATWKRYAPDDPYTYALEVEAGLLVEHGVAPDTVLHLPDR